MRAGDAISSRNSMACARLTREYLLSKACVGLKKSDVGSCDDVRWRHAMTAKKKIFVINRVQNRGV